MFCKNLKFLTLALAFSALQSMFALSLEEEAKATYQWDDMSVFRINKEPARASFVLCDSLDSAKTRFQFQMSAKYIIQSLTGC